MLSEPTEMVHSTPQARPPEPDRVVPAFKLIDPFDRLNDPVSVIAESAASVSVVEYVSL